MSVASKSGLAGGNLGGNQHPHESGAPAVRNAGQSGKRPFSRLYSAALSGLRKFVYRRPDAPASEHPALAQSSLQRGNAVLQRSKSLAMARFSEGGDAGCVLCAVEHQDAARLCQLVGILPIGRKVQLSMFPPILGVRYRTVSCDFHFLIHELRLPIERTRRGIKLT